MTALSTGGRKAPGKQNQSCSTGSRRAPLKTALLGALLMLTASAHAAPFVLDWDDLTWTPEGNTNLSETYTIGNAPLTVTFSGNTAELDQDQGGGASPISPSINSQNTGGLAPVEDGLHVAADYASQTNTSVTVTINFDQYPGGVSNINFSIFDIDASGSFIDRATVTAVSGGATVNPTSRVTSVDNQTFGANAIQGISPAGGTTSDGNATFGFNQTGITQLSITYSNEIGISNPGFQFMNIHDITFDAPVADVGITKLVDNIAPSIGSDVTFTLNAVNNGPDAAPSVEITDVLPAGYTYVSDTSGGAFDSGTGVWTIGSMPNGGTDSIDIVATVNATGPYANTATVTDVGADDNVPGNDQSTVTPVPVNDADLSLVKSVAPAAPLVGSNVTFTLTLNNAGAGGATGVTVLDQLPSGFTFVSSTPSQGTYANGTGVWNVGAVANGGTATLDIIATVRATGSYVNSAQVNSSDQGDPDSTPGNNVPAEDDQSAVTVTPAEIGVAKAVTAGPTSNGDGSFDLTYTITVANTGAAPLSAVQVTDDLSTTFAGATSFSVVSVASTDFVANGGFNGAGDQNLLAGTDTLAVGISGTVAVTVRVTPGGALGPYNNLANGTGTAPGGATPTDTSTNGSNVDPDNDGDPTDNSVPTPVSFTETPDIGTAKSAATPVNNGDGTYDVTYTVLVENTGDVSLTNVQATDSLTTTFSGAAFTVAAPTSADFAVNAGYNGSANTNLLAGTDTLAAGASGTVQFVVTVTPGSNLGPYNNSATGRGTSPGGAPVTDTSTNGSNVDPDNNGDPGNNSTPTPVSFNEAPQIGTAKDISSGPTNNADGTYSLSYTITVANTGDVPLSALQVTENLATTFATADGFTVGAPTSADFSINGSFNGIGNVNLLDGSDTLAAGASGTIVVPVVVTPGASLGPYNNTATARGRSPGGTNVSDASTDGANVDPDGNGDPGNNSTPTPVSFTETPQIGTAKALTTGPTNNGDGTYALSYTIVVENTGDVTLDSVQVVEDFAATFAAADGFTVGTPTSADFTINPDFNGAADTDLLTGVDTLLAAASGTIVVPVTVTPGASLGPYNNTATASGTSPAGTDVDDDSTNGADVDPDNDGPGNNSTPTPATFAEAPEIGTAKQITAGPTSNGDGSFTLTYSVLVENTGDVTLTGVQVSDDLATTYASATSFSVTNPVSADFTVNGGFDGDANQNLLAGTDTLAAGATGTVTFNVTVTPGADLGPYNNTATASGTSPAGTGVNDDSTDGADVDPDNDGPGNNSTPTPATFSETPEIGVAKAITSAPVNDGLGNFTLDYTIRVDNTGDVALNAVQVTDDLATVFAAATSFTVLGISSPSFAVNAGFDGSADQNLLAGTDTLEPSVRGTIVVTLTVTPGGNLGPYNNTATGSGTSPGGTSVTDVSQSGANVDPDSNGDPTDNNAPTPVSFTEEPGLGAAKALTSGPTSNGDGTFSLVYTILIENTGDVVLSGVQIDEDFDTTFSTAASYVVGLPTSATLSVNAGFDGSVDTNVLDGTDTLALASTATVDIPVTVTPGANLGPYENEATAQGTSPAGTPVSDITTNGADPDPDADSDPGNNSTPTPVTFVEMPEIGVAKEVVGVPTNNAGVYTVVYNVLIENTGDVDLNTVQATDNLSATFGAADSFSVVSITSADFAINAGFNGVGNQNLLTGTNVLAAGDSGTVRLTVRVTPGASLGPYNNTANASGQSPTAVPVNDVSTDGNNVDPDADGPGDNSVPTPVTFAEDPEIGLAKAVIAGPTNNADGTTDVTYRFRVRNTGDVPLQSVQVTDDLTTTFGAVAFAVQQVTTSAGLSPNPAFDGDGTQTLLLGADALAVGASATISVVVRITPNGALGPFNNTAQATAQSAAGTGVTDDSTDGTNVDPTSDGDPTNDSTPTPLTLTEMPQIGIAKTVSTEPVANNDGTFTLTYTLTVENIGDVELRSVQVTDSLATTFAGAASFSAVSASSTDFATSGAYDGDASPTLLSGLDTLAVGASGTIDITVTVAPGANLGPYNNSASATGQSPSGVPASDDSVDGTVPDFDGNGDPNNDTSPTPVSFMEMPQIGLAKSVNGAPVNNGDGTFTLTYTLTVDNVGDVAVTSLQVTDDLDATFAGATYVVDTTASTDFAVDAGFDGSATQTLLAGTDMLAPGANGTINVTVTVTPAVGALGPFDNTATVTGASPAGAAVMDISQSGANVDPDGDGDPGNNSDPTPVSFSEAPQIGAAKSLSTAPTSNGDGTFDLTYTVTIENLGDVILSAVQVVEDFDTTFALADAYAVQSVASTDFTANGAFDGSANTNVLDGSDTLALGATGTVDIVVRVTPGSELGPYENAVQATGTSPAGTPVSDDSTDGLDPDPDADDNPGNNGDPTPVTFSETPQIGVAKAVSSLPTSNADGTFTLTYTITVENTGDVTLAAVQVAESLATTFAGATAFTNPVVTSADFAPNSNFDGDAVTNLLTGTDALAPAASGTIDVTVTVEPGTNLGPYDNTVTATGTSPGGANVTDDSTDGTNVDPDADGDPGNNSTPTPTLFNEMPVIGSAKQVTDGPTPNGDGSFTLSYTVRIENTGDVMLGAVQLVDNLATTFTAATGFSDVSASSTDFAVNPAYDGSTDTNVLAGTDMLDVGMSGTVVITVTVMPGMDLGPYNNTATAAGTSPGGATVNDDSTDGANVDPDADGDPGNDGVPTPVMFMEMPQLGVAKSISAGPTELGDGSFDLTYTIRVTNTGDVDVVDLQVMDTLTAVFPAPATFTVGGVASGDFAVNTAYDGTTDTSTLAGTDTLLAGETGTLSIALNVNPGGNLGPYNNTATATGASPAGMAVSDVSQSGTNVDPDGNGDPSDNSDPTPVSFNENPQLGAAKAVTDGPINNGDGSFTVTYTVTITNTGDVDLSVLQITEDLDETFNGATNIVVDSVTSADFAPNPGFDGVSDTNLLGGADVIPVGANSTAVLTVTVTPDGNLGPFSNTVVASGQTPNGTPVSDDSTDGIDPDPEGDGPGDNNTPTPVEFVEAPVLGVALNLVNPPVNNGDGTFTVTYEVTVENRGDVPLDGLQVIDSLATTYAPTDGYTVGSVVSPDFTVNPNYDGDADTSLLAGTDTLPPGSSGDILITVIVTPGMELGPLDNSATASGTTPGGADVTDISQNGVDVDPDGDADPGNNSDPTPVTFPGALAALQGNAWLDADVDDNFDVGESPLEGWIVQVIQNGTVIGTANVQPDGSYTVTDLPPGDYSLQLLNPVNNAVFGVIDMVTLPSGTTIIDQNLPIDPSGVVYDSDTRDPIAGALVELVDSNGTPLPDVCLLPAQQSQLTGADGQYRFDVVLDADPACPSGATFSIAVTPPNDYLDPPSSIIPAQAGALDPTGLGDPFAVAPQPGAPQGGDSTVYYLNFTLANGDPNVINNHIPLDPPGTNVDVRLIKTAEKRQGTIGDLIPYSITAENIGVLPITNLTISDNIPAGFSFVQNSARLVGDGTLTVDGQRPVNFNGINIPVGGQATVRYILRVGAGVTQGEYVNTATPLVAGVVVGNTATARVAIVSDPDIEQTTIIGKVFNDLNGDGYQDPSEFGIPGVRLATVEGLLVETDAFGRYHLEGIDGGFFERGRNFIIKVDPSTLPDGALFTTENPRVKRITQGLMNQFDFGVRLPGQAATRYERVQVKLGEVFFVPGSTAVRPEFEPLLDQLADRVRQHGGGTLIFEGSCDVDAARAANGVVTTAPYTLTPRFGVRKATLTAPDRAELDRIAAQWAGATNVQIESIGHTSNVRIAPQNRKEFADNYVLSRARAQAVADYLSQTLALSTAQVRTDGRGPDQPVASNGTSEGRAQNRRVELRITGTRGNVAPSAAPVSCDDNLAQERARNVFEQLKKRLGDCKVCDIDVRIGDVPVPTDTNNTQSHIRIDGETTMKKGRVARLMRRGLGVVLSTFIVSAHAQEPALADCTVDSCATDEGYAIQIIGYGDGNARPGSPFDTAAVQESDDRVDITGEFMIRLPSGGMLWATEDPAVKDPRIALHSDDVFAVKDGRIVQPIEFFVYKNYDAFIERAVLEIYHDRDVDRLKPLASLPLPKGDFVSVEWDGRSNVPLRIGDQLFYVVKAYDNGGRMDRTREKTTTGVSVADYAAHKQEAMPRNDQRGGDAQEKGGPIATALLSSPLNGKVAVMKPPVEIQDTESLAYTLSPKFDTRKWALKPDDRAELDRIIRDWRDAINIEVTAIGHTDYIRIAPEHRDEVANNQVLSENRARAVVDYIAAGLGLGPGQINAIGRGKTEPVGSNTTVEGRARNRRVELTVRGNRVTQRSLQALAVEMVDPGSNAKVPVTGTMEEALNLLTAQTGDTTPGASQFLFKDQGRRLSVDCSVAQTHRHELQAVYGRNELEKQNIPMYGSRVRLHGQDVDGNFALQVNDRMVPIDTEGKFAVDYMMPVGQHNLDVEFMDQNCVVRDQADIKVDVDGKHMFIVALADFTASDSSISGSLEPLSVDDRYDEDFLIEGRMAFYLKGKVRGKYLITAQLDTREEELSDILDNLDNKDPQQIFRRLDPDRYYPVYGDDSTTIADTDSIGRMYVRADWDSSHAMWGNFHTNYTGTEFGQYNRSLYGAQLDWHSLKANVNGDSKTTANLFVSENQTELGHSEFIGTGGSLYYLRHTDVLPGSEKVRVEIRDRDSDRVLQNITLTRGVDYEVDEIQGRLLLARPLMQITRLLAPTLIKDRALDGNAAILIADYEYIPDGFSPDHIGYGGRASHWFGDHLQVGGTYVAEGRGAAEDHTLGSVDVKIQAAPHTFIKMEFAQTEENQVERFLSNDGGLRFQTLGAGTTAADRDGSAYSVEARMNTREWLGTANEWVVASWYRHSDAGFSIARRDNGVDVDEYGAEVVGQLGERLTLTGRGSVVERETQRDDVRMSLQADYRLSDRSLWSGELRHVEADTSLLDGGAVNLVNRTDVGNGTLAALRYTRILNDRWRVYGGGQVSLSQSDAYDNNDMVTVGMITKVGDRTDFIAEYSDGHRGDGASVSLDHAINDRHRVYGTYTHSTDRTDTLANDQIAIGQRSRISNQLTVFNEHQFSNYRDTQAGIGHVFGLDYALETGWNIGATFQTGELETGFGLIDRTAISGSLGFQGDRVMFSTKLEVRDDDGVNTDSDQVVSSSRMDYRFSPSIRFLGRLNLSETEDNVDPNFDAKFTEGQVGMAYRPVHHNRFNMLAKYTFLYDLRGFDQQQTNTDQRSNIWSLEGLYQFNPHWGLGAKYAYRHGELRTDRNTGDWFESTTNFFAIRGRYHLIREWDALAEYRWLDVDEAESTRSGFLIGVSKHIGNNFKLGLGYNFTDFSDDLTNLDYDHKGWFINALGKY